MSKSGFKPGPSGNPGGRPKKKLKPDEGVAVWAEPYDENCEPDWGPNFVPYMRIAKDGSAEYIIGNHNRLDTVSVNRDVFRDAVALYHAASAQQLLRLVTVYTEDNGNVNLSVLLQKLLTRDE